LATIKFYFIKEKTTIYYLVSYLLLNTNQNIKKKYIKNMNESTYKNAYGYIRWSTTEQDDGDSERRQTDYINSTIKKLNLPLIRIFKDKGVSASNGKNLECEWKQLKNILQPNDIILVENIDRITRKGSRTFYNTLGEIVEDRNAFIIITGPTNNGLVINKNNYENDWNIKIQNTVANTSQNERTRKIKDAHENMIKTLKSGKFIKVGYLPMWIKNGDGRFIVDEQKANVVRKIFDMYMKGNSIGQITGYLNKSKVPTPNKNTNGWNPSSVNYILRNKAVIGYLRQFEENIKLYTPIIEEDIYWAVKNKLNERREYKGRNGKKGQEVGLFKNIIICSKCNNGMFRHSGGKRPHSYYRCCGIYKKTCDAHGIRVEDFERSFQELLSRSKIVAESLTENKPTEPFKLDVLKGKLKECKNKQERLTPLIVNDPTPSENLIKSLKEEESEERRLLREIDIEEAVIRSATPVLSILSNYKQFFEDKWNAPESKLQIRECIRAMIKKIVVDKKNKSYKVIFNGNDVKPINVALLKDGCNINGLEIIYPIEKS
jgi:DNA invertase Pin-like site-specific DNA recombinase